MYDYWILHKKLVLDETFTIIYISTHISLNIGSSILNLHIPEYPFPLAGHIWSLGAYSKEILVQHVAPPCELLDHYNVVAGLCSVLYPFILNQHGGRVGQNLATYK